MNHQKLSVALIVITCFSLIRASSTDLQLGTRPQGMGCAFVALADDANAVYWNPAGLTQITSGEATFMHWNFAEIEQLKVNYLSLAYPLYKGAVGFCWIRQHAELEEGPFAEKSRMSEDNFLLSYGMSFIPRFNIGISLNRLVINSEAGNGAGFGFEFGGLYYPVPDNDWTIGIITKNIAANLKNEYLRPYFIFGTAYKFRSTDQKHFLAIAFDLNTKSDIDGKEGTTLKYAVGLEYLYRFNNTAFALRGGYGSKNYSIGFGVSLSYFSIDYAFVKMHENTIGNSHKFGISFKFGKGYKQEYIARQEVEKKTEKKIKKKQVKKEKDVEKKVEDIFGEDWSAIPDLEALDELKLTGKVKNQKVYLQWNSIFYCDGYEVYARIDGVSEWKPTHEGLLKKTQKTISYSQKNVKVEFMVIAMLEGQVISRSNVIKIKF
jgi:hypothetical protein